eukprot:Skav202402  [mRNA]  locus=scaffold815:446110:454313:+ [translate_table: standard]
MSTDTEASVRDDLAAIHRICHKLGLNEGVCNHLSALIPGTNNDRFLIAPYGMLWSAVTPKSLVVVDSKGHLAEMLSGRGATRSCLKWTWQLRKNVAVLHTHMPHTTALCVIQNSKLQLGEKRVGLQKHHGVFVCGKTLAQAFDSWMAPGWVQKHRLCQAWKRQLREEDPDLQWLADRQDRPKGGYDGSPARSPPSMAPMGSFFM